MSDPREQPGLPAAARRELERAPPFRPPPWLRGAHAQTVWSPLFRRRHRPPLPFALERLTTPDRDFVRLHHLAGRPGSPRLVILHGLEGSVRSNYVGGLARRAGARGWAVTALEFRSCGGELNRGRRLYHLGETWDLDHLVGELTRREPGRPLLLGGVSLGANVIVKWLGERGEDAPAEVRGAAAISAPFDLTVSGPVLDRALGGLYTRRFLRTLIPKALAKERQYPGSIDRERVARARTFAEFDTWATARLHGFRDAWDYWERCSSGPFLERVRRPLLLVSAADDPFNPAATLPRGIADRNPRIAALFTERGGHVGFVEGTPWRPRHWAEERAVGFLAAVAGVVGGEHHEVV
ncbi:MAG TPA: alpha/beta fold hydrolase [Thermoanaerobaculia bacterium]|nr:alpha/beta fold hydrolase [Thermoanaerobaculia bacterium]